MSLPTAGDIAGRTGILQNNLSNTNVGTRKTREADQGRQAVLRDEEEEEGKAKASGGKGPGGTGGTSQAQFGQEEKKKVRRKKVNVGQAARERNKSEQANATEGASQGNAAGKAKKQEAPANAREMGIKKATNLLNQQSRLTEASVKYEQARNQADNTGTNPLSPKGQQRWMLNNLIKMSEVNYQQHTGGSAGELLNRRSSREVFMALRGLRDGAPKTEKSNDTSNSRGLSSGEYKLKQAQAMTILNQVLEPPVRPEHHEPLELVA